MKKISLVIMLVAAINLMAQSPSLKLNNLSPNSSELQHIDPSKEGEITIASMNIRDMRGTKRTLENLQYLADILDEADIIVLQEIGAKGYSSAKSAIALEKRIDAFSAAFLSYLGREWVSVKSPVPTPERLGMGAEIPLVFYKTSKGEINIKGYWKEYADLGTKRDMGVFSIYLSKEEESTVFELGTVHTKPTCPERGKQLYKIKDYIASAEVPFIICGDFNWGYKSETSCEIRFEGEEALLQLESEGKITMPFSDISYLGGGDVENFRTNLMLRRSVNFYDQFLLSDHFINKYADGCSLSEDCGFISISTSDEYKSIMKDEVKTQMKGAKVALKLAGTNCDIDQSEVLDQVESKIEKDWKSVDAASYLISDHKPIWVQVKPFN